MQYDTNNLDEATYLALQGFPFKTKRTGPASANFSFEVGKGFEEIRSKFWKGEASVQLHRWLATRAAIKHEVAGQPVIVKQVAAPSIVPTQQGAQLIEVRPGLTYWYWEGAGVKAAMFGNRTMHTDRPSERNFYRTREDALLKRNAIQVV